MQFVIFLPLIMTIIITYSAIFSPKGSILILENPDGTGFLMDFKQWSSKNKCELSLKEGDILQFQVDRKDGKIAFVVNGKNGSEPYTGNSLESGLFTVRVSETDTYEFQITGKNATGKVTVKNINTVPNR